MAAPVLPTTGAVVVVVTAAGAASFAGAGFGWANALSGRITRLEATNRLEMRVMIFSYGPGGMFRLRRIKPWDCDASGMEQRRKWGNRCHFALIIRHLRR